MKKYWEFKMKLTEPQHKKIKSEAGDLGLSMQDYGRFSLLGFNGQGKVPHLSDISYNVGKMSVNVNQIAKACNTAKYKTDISDDVLSEFTDTIKTYLAKLYDMEEQLVRLSKHDAH